MKKGQKLPLRLSSAGHRINDYLLYLWAVARKSSGEIAIHPSNKNIAKHCKCSIRTVVRQTRVMERLGLMKSWKQLPFSAYNKWLPRQRYCGRFNRGRLRDKIASILARAKFSVRKNRISDEERARIKAVQAQMRREREQSVRDARARDPHLSLSQMVLTGTG